MIYVALGTCESNYKSQHATSLKLLNSLLRELGYEDVAVTKSDSGRPITNNTAVDVSISHSKTLAAVAVICESATNCDDFIEIPIIGDVIGIDVEEIDENADVERIGKIAKRFIGIDVSTPEDFYFGWTQHEAYGKMTGEGIKAKKVLPYVNHSYTVEFNGKKYALSIATK